MPDPVLWHSGALYQLLPQAEGCRRTTAAYPVELSDVPLTTVVNVRCAARAFCGCCV